MCLNINTGLISRLRGNNRVKVADCDIVVYKALINQEGELYAPYFSETHYPLQKTMPKVKLRRVVNTVHDGYHTYKNLGDAREFCIEDLYKVVRCIIPTGTKYMQGRVNKRAEGFVSETLFVDAII